MEVRILLSAAMGSLGAFMGNLFAAGRKIAIQSGGKIVVAGDAGKVDPLIPMP